MRGSDSALWAGLGASGVCLALLSLAVVLYGAFVEPFAILTPADVAAQVMLPEALLLSWLVWLVLGLRSLPRTWGGHLARLLVLLAAGFGAVLCAETMAGYLGDLDGAVSPRIAPLLPVP